MKEIEKISFRVDSQHKFDEKTYSSKEYVLAGDNNDMFEKLYEYADYSPIHNVCLRSKTDSVVGQGFTKDYKVNKFENLNQFFRKLVREYIITGNAFVECIWANDRNEGLKSLYVLPTENVRVGKTEKEHTMPEYYYYCDDFQKTRKHSVIQYDRLDPMVYSNKQIYHIKTYTPGFKYYGQPSYMSVLNDVILNHKISVHHLANITNGGRPSLWVNFRNGEPGSEREMNDILYKLKEKYSGAENSGEIIVSYSDTDNGPEISQISTDNNDQYYSVIYEQIQKQILSGHKITDGSLIGLPTSSGFASQAEQLETAYQLFLNTTIKPIQRELIEQMTPLLELMYPDETINLEIIQNPIL